MFRRKNVSNGLDLSQDHPCLRCSTVSDSIHWLRVDLAPSVLALFADFVRSDWELAWPLRYWPCLPIMYLCHVKLHHELAKRNGENGTSISLQMEEHVRDNFCYCKVEYCEKITGYNLKLFIGLTVRKVLLLNFRSYTLSLDLFTWYLQHDKRTFSGTSLTIRKHSRDKDLN